VIESASDLTIKGPGGFIRIDAGGVTIEGVLVKINSGGSPGSGSGASPEQPDEAIEATVGEPDKPQPEDVGKTGLRQ
jgi:type VI secretion system secreted protein VgrG